MTAYTDMVAKLRDKVNSPLSGLRLARRVEEEFSSQSSSVPVRFSDDPEVRRAATHLARRVEEEFSSQNLTVGRCTPLARGPFQGNSPTERLRDEVRHLQGQLRYWRQQHDCDMAALDKMTKTNSELAQRALVAEMGLRELQARRLSEFMQEHVDPHGIHGVDEKPKSSMPANALRFGNGRYDKRPL